MTASFRRLLILFGLTLLLVLGFAPMGTSNAFAQAQITENFQCNENGTASVPLFEQRTCNITETTIFAGTVCTFEQTLSQIFSNLYCGTKNAIMTPLMLTLTLAIILFAIAFLTGITQMSTGEAAKLGFKLLLVFVFATQAEMAIGLAYKFFMSTAQEGITIVLRKLAPSTAYQMDANGNPIIINSWDVDGAMKYMDDLIIESATPLTYVPANVPGGEAAGGTCQNALIVLIALTMLFLPPLALMIIYVIFQTMFMFVRAVVGYLLAITGITFLMTLSPIFLCFSLFHPTYKFFEKWLQYIISFTLQMIIIFAFLALTQLMDIGKFLGRVLELVKPYQLGGGEVARIAGAEQGSTLYTILNNMRLNIPMCSICEYEMRMEPYYNMELPFCKTGADFKVIPPWDLSFHSDFASMLVMKLVTLGILAYVLEAFLKYVPEIAKQIAGVPWSARVGGGNIESAFTSRFGTEGGTAGFLGGSTMQNANRGFLQGWNTTDSTNSVSRVVGALTGAGRTMPGSIKSEVLGMQGLSGGRWGQGSYIAEKGLSGAGRNNAMTYMRIKD